MDDIDIRARQVGYDVATLFRVAPWIFLMRDQRDPKALVRAALGDIKGFIEAHLADPTRSREALVRGLLTTFIQATGVKTNPETINIVAHLVTSAIDETVTEAYTPELQAEKA